MKVILHDALKIQVHVTFKMSPVFLWEAFLRKPRFLGRAILYVEPGKKARNSSRTEALGSKSVRNKLWVLALFVCIKAKEKN